MKTKHKKGSNTCRTIQDNQVFSYTNSSDEGR